MNYSKLIDYSRLIGPNGHYRTQSMFYEFRFQTDSDYMPFTLKERNHKGLLSAYKIYMSCDSEYEAAYKMLNSWKHWELLCESPWFMKELTKWRCERDIREAALGKATLIDQAQDGNAAAARALIDLSNKKKVGRPTKLEVEAEKKKQAAIDNKVTNILERMADK